MSFALALSRAIDRLTAWIGKASAWLILAAVLVSASIASMIRCRAESAPMVMSVPTMSLSMEPTSPAIINAG